MAPRICKHCGEPDIGDHNAYYCGLLAEMERPKRAINADSVARLDGFGGGI